MVKKHIGIILILLLAGFLRFYNLMHDAPYFFNPDERNMASAITQFQLPNQLAEIPNCLYSEFFSSSQPLTTNYQLSTNCSLNPHFFAYGQFPLYLAYLSDQIQQSLFPLQPITNNELRITSFASAIYWLRFWSAVSSVGVVLLIYLIINQLFNFSVLEIGNWSASWRMEIGNYAALMAAFIPGFIQSAHFGTTESLLTFFFLCSLYFSLKLFNNVIPVKTGIQSLKDRSQVLSRMTKGVNSKFLILNSLSCGLAIGSKMTGVFFLVPPCLAIGFNFLIQKKRKIKDIFFQAFAHLRILAFFFIMTAFFAIISSPYNLVQPDNFFSAVFGYEADVARGKYEAFYTRQFVHTTPLLFQFEKIFPYSLGIVLTVVGTVGFALILKKIITFRTGDVDGGTLRKNSQRQSEQEFLMGVIRGRTRKSKIYINFSYLLIISSFLIYLIPNAFLFAKWSRFMTPILPFFVIFSMFLFNEINQRLNNFRLLFNILLCALLIAHCAFGLAFFSIYTCEDSRFTASRWIYKNIPSNAYILSETGNVIDIPFPLPSPSNIMPIAYSPFPISFDFYHLEENRELQTQLIFYLEKANYIFVPSRRIFDNYTREPDRYPILNRYYDNLFNGNLGFEKVAEIKSFPSLGIGPPAGGWKLEINDESAEETYTVFDHPVIRIYKKNQSKTSVEYQKLLIPLDT